LLGAAAVVVLVLLLGSAFLFHSAAATAIQPAPAAPSTSAISAAVLEPLSCPSGFTEHSRRGRYGCALIDLTEARRCASLASVLDLSQCSVLCAATGASCVAFGLELDLGHAWRNSPSCWLYSRLPDAQEELHDDDAATTQSVMCRKLE
jgi:hypothetical protein